MNLNFVFFDQDQALGGPGSFGAGGAIEAASAVINGTAVKFTNNQAIGGAAASTFPGGSGQGGAILSNTSTLRLTSPYFSGNQAIGGAGQQAAGGSGLGGAVQVLNGLARIVGGQFYSNAAVGGAAGTVAGDGLGGGLYSDPASALTLLSSNVRRNRAVGATGRGGGVYLTFNGMANLKGTTVLQNTASTDSPNVFGPFTT
jgi:hypothetical protein